jgi:hypothetical protein
MKLPLNRGGLRFYLVLIALLCGRATHATILAGVPLVVLGAAIHLWAKGCLQQNQVVARGGPYRFVRHPFYLANALVDAAIAVMSGWWLLQVVLPFWWLAVYLPVIRGEERYLTGAFGSVYEDYKKRVPCLLPWRRPLPAGEDGFRWRNRNITADGALGRSLRLLAYPALFWVSTDLRAEGFVSLSQAPQWLALATLGLVYGLAWAFGQRRVAASRQ